MGDIFIIVILSSYICHLFSRSKPVRGKWHQYMAPCQVRSPRWPAGVSTHPYLLSQQASLILSFSCETEVDFVKAYSSVSLPLTSSQPSV